MAQSARPKICLLLGPGTLHSRGADRMDFLRYRLSGKPRYTGEEMLAALPEVAQVADVEVDAANPHEVATLNDLHQLALHIGRLLARSDVEGVVLVQGTNSLEETAYFLNLTVRSAKPVVVVGAQRPFTALSADAQLNLYDAIRVAAAPQTHGKGVVVATNGEINAAREVTKTHTYRVQTFRSRDMGLLGYVDADRIEYYRAPLRKHTTASEFDVAAVDAIPYVEVLYVHDGGHAGMAQAAIDLGAKGLVIAGSGAGGLGNLEAAIYRIVDERQAIVVQGSRVGEGRVVSRNNWFRDGMVVADNLSPHKSALLLALALTRTGDTAAIQRIFDEY